MVRKLSAVAAALAVLTAGSLAHAQRASASFGDTGEFIVSADHLMPFFSYTHTSAVEPTAAVKTVDHANATSLGFFYGGTEPILAEGAPNPYTVPRVGFDVVALPNLTFGGDVILFFNLGANASTEVDNNNGGSQTNSGPGPKYTVFGVAPRVGYVLHLNELLSLWLRGGLTYVTETGSQDTGQGANTRANFDQLSLDLDPQLAITPFPHMGFTVGATSNIPLTGGNSITATDNGSSQSASAHASLFYVGVNAGLFVYF